jgi:hypothetical protein
MDLKQTWLEKNGSTLMKWDEMGPRVQESKGVIHPELRLVIFIAETSETAYLTAAYVYVRTYVDRHEHYCTVSTMI